MAAFEIPVGQFDAVLKALGLAVLERAGVGFRPAHAKQVEHSEVDLKRVRVAGSYPRANCAAFVTISVRFEFVHTVGVLHDGISTRGVAHTRHPSSRLYAARNESWLRSNWRMTSPSWMTGELPKPHSYSWSIAKLESMVLRSRFHSGLPSRS